MFRYKTNLPFHSNKSLTGLERRMMEMSNTVEAFTIRGS